jgi:hypothetical protein
MLRHTGTIAVGVAPVVLVARASLPSRADFVFLVVLVLGVACWVIGSEARTERVSRMLLAWRGNPECLAPRADISPPQPSPRPRRRFLSSRL